MKRRWTFQEEQTLSHLYGKIDWQALLESLPGRTKPSVALKARSLGLFWYEEGKTHPQVQGDLSVLLQDTPEAYYWMGFLMADGYCANERIRLTLANKDVDQVRRFAGFVKSECHLDIRRGQAHVRVQDKVVVPKIREKFDWKDRKTYHPPRLQWWSKDLFISFFIGFVDGDGSIRRQSGRKDCTLAIKVHRSWSSVLQQMMDRVAQESKVPVPAVRLDNRGYALSVISNRKTLRWLSSEVKNLCLPVLSRKWSLLDDTALVLSRQEKGEINKKKVLDYKKQGMRTKDIFGHMDMSKMGVYAILRKLKKEGLI